MIRRGRVLSAVRAVASPPTERTAAPSAVSARGEAVSARPTGNRAGIQCVCVSVRTLFVDRNFVLSQFGLEYCQVLAGR